MEAALGSYTSSLPPHAPSEKESQMATNQQRMGPFFEQRTAAWIVFGIVTVVLVGLSFGTAGWIGWLLLGNQPEPNVTVGYTNYEAVGDYQASPAFAEAQQQYRAYVAEYPEPQNVKILTGLSTAEIYGIMVNQFSGGLKVSCQHCHNLSQGNFADETNPNKHVSRQMLLMAADLNQNWITQLPASVGNKQISCATCHNGAAVNFNGGQSGALSNYPADQSPLPDGFQIKLDTPADIELLQLTGKLDPNLAAVQYNQYVMSHMNASLGVGCSFCHNAAYFPSNEIAQKGYALTMLKMIQYLYTGPGPNSEYQYSDPNYRRGPGYLAAMNNKVPSCWMCHRGAQLPPGSMDANAVPAQISSNPPQQ